MAVAVSTGAKSEIMGFFGDGLGSSNALLKNTANFTVDILPITLLKTGSMLGNNSKLIFEVSASSGNNVTLDYVQIQSISNSTRSLYIGLNTQTTFTTNGLYAFEINGITFSFA